MNTHDRGWTWTANTIHAAALAVIVAAAVGRVFDFTHLPDYGEGTLLVAVERMQREPLTPQWLEEPPYTLCPYGPIYYWAATGATKLLGLEHTLVPGRLVSLAATLATIALLAAAVWHLTGSLAMGLLTAALYLANPIIRGWGVVYRVDALATLMALAAYLLASRGGRGLVASALCVAAGSLVKQTAALAALPIFVWLLLKKRYRAALGYGLLVGMPGIAGWLAVDRLGDGYFLSCAVKGHMGPMSLKAGFWKIYEFFAVPLALLGLASVLWLTVARPWSAARSLYAVGFVLSTVLATLLSSRQGAVVCYYMEALTLAALASGSVALRGLARRHSGRAAWAAAVLSVFLALPEVQSLRRQGRHWDVKPYASEMLASKLPLQPGDWVLADGQHLDAVARAGLVPAVNDSFFFRLSVEGGRTSPQQLVDAVQDGRIRWLILRRPLEEHVRQVDTASQKWPATLLDAMQQQFQLTASDDGIFLYGRRGGGGER